MISLTQVNEEQKRTWWDPRGWFTSFGPVLTNKFGFIQNLKKRKKNLAGIFIGKSLELTKYDLLMQFFIVAFHFFLVIYHNLLLNFLWN